MSLDIQCDVDNCASFNNLDDQNDDNNCLKVIDDDYDGAHISDNKADQFTNVVARQESDYIQEIADDSDHVKQSDNDSFQVVYDVCSVIKISDHNEYEARSNDTGYLQAVSDDYLLVIGDGWDDVQIAGNNGNQSTSSTMCKFNDNIRTAGDYYLQLHENSSYPHNYSILNTSHTLLTVIYSKLYKKSLLPINGGANKKNDYLACSHK